MFDVQNGKYSLLNFVPNQDLAPGSSTSLPSTGDVTAVGIYNFHDINFRMDTFVVTQVIPEPATIGLVGVGLVGLLCRRR